MYISRIRRAAGVGGTPTTYNYGTRQAAGVGPTRLLGSLYSGESGLANFRSRIVTRPPNDTTPLLRLSHPENNRKRQISLVNYIFLSISPYFILPFPSFFSMFTFIF